MIFRYRYIGKLKGNNIYEYFWNGISKIPIKRINFNDSLERRYYNNILEYVSLAIDYSKKILNYSISDYEKAILNKELDSVKKEIDLLVYNLYNISIPEREIIKNKLKNNNI